MNPNPSHILLYKTNTWMFSMVNASDSLIRSILYTLSLMACAASSASVALTLSFARSSGKS